MDMQGVTDTLGALFAQSGRVTAVLLSGAPGIGKTACIAAAAAKAHKPVLTLPLPTMEAVDLRGMPTVIGGRTQWASPLPRDGEGVLILDEVSSAAPDVQVAAHHLVWAEAGSDMSVPNGWHIVLTGNRATDKTLYRAMSGPLRNRLLMLNVEVNPLQWADWAAQANVHPFVVAFIRWLPDALMDKEVPADGAFPSPRAWDRAGRLLNLAVGPDVERELLAGTVGLAAATKFSAYLEMARTLPDIQSILDNPEKANVPKEPSLRYAITCSLAQYTRCQKVSAMRYVARLPADFGVVYLREIRDQFDIRSDADIREWIGKHKSAFLDE